MSGNPRPLTLEQPLDIDEARRAARKIAELRRAAEEEFEHRLTEAADLERGFRKAYARAYVSIEGTAAQRDAQARSDASEAAYKRDLALGLVKAAQERLRGLEGERSLLKSLIDWSCRLDPFAVAERQPERAA